MKTPDEIKRGLECCHELACTKCPYWLTKGCAEVLQEDAKVCIQQLEQSVPRWISVEERLPENDDAVLIMDNGIGMGYYNIYSDEWTDCETADTIRVTHWMPLPEPPKEGEDHATQD